MTTDKVGRVRLVTRNRTGNCKDGDIGVVGPGWVDLGVYETERDGKD